MSESNTPNYVTELQFGQTVYTLEDENAVRYNQGSANAGKVLGVDDDGSVIPVDFEGDDFEGATASEAGTHGYVPAPAAGDQGKFLKGDGTWGVVDQADFTGATASAAGAHGMVPAPAAGEQAKVLTGNGTWQVAPGARLIETSGTVTNTSGSYIGTFNNSDVTADQQAIQIELGTPSVFRSTISVTCGNGAVTVSCSDVVGTSTIKIYSIKSATDAQAITSAEFDILDAGKADKVASATNGNFAGLDANGNLTDSGSKASDFLTQHQDISGKADKVASATSGNIAALDANGNLVDSGKTLGKSVPSNAVFTDTTYSVATQSANGLMSSADKKKLDGVATGATANVVSNSLSDTSTTNALSAAKGKELSDRIGNVPSGENVENQITVLNNRLLKTGNYTSHAWDTTIAAQDAFDCFGNGQIGMCRLRFSSDFMCLCIVNRTSNTDGSVLIISDYSSAPKYASKVSGNWTIKTLQMS